VADWWLCLQTRTSVLAGLTIAVRMRVPTSKARTNANVTTDSARSLQQPSQPARLKVADCFYFHKLHSFIACAYKVKNSRSDSCGRLVYNNNNNVRLLNCWHTAQLTILTSATQGSTIYRRVKPAKLLPHTAHSDWINCTGLTSWAFARWCDRHTSDKVAHYSIYRPRKDERLSWPWMACYILK